MGNVCNTVEDVTLTRLPPASVEIMKSPVVQDGYVKLHMCAPQTSDSQKLPSPVTRKKQKLEVVSSRTLLFSVDPHADQYASQTLRLQNPPATGQPDFDGEPLEFRVTASHPHLFSVLPECGVVAVGETVELKLQMRTPEWEELKTLEQQRVWFFIAHCVHEGHQHLLASAEYSPARDTSGSSVALKRQVADPRVTIRKENVLPAAVHVVAGGPPCLHRHKPHVQEAEARAHSSPPRPVLPTIHESQQEEHSARVELPTEKASWQMRMIGYGVADTHPRAAHCPPMTPIDDAETARWCKRRRTVPPVSLGLQLSPQPISVC